MVVLDTEFNGYRDIILPMACGDGVVQRAVSVVSAFHLAATLPELQLPADVGQMNIISRLRRDASVLPSNELFNVSTWATILVLLVGETVTGGNDFIYLLEMLRCVTQSSVDKIGISASVRQFFIQQTRMYVISSLSSSCIINRLEKVRIVRVSIIAGVERHSNPETKSGLLSRFHVIYADS